MPDQTFGRRSVIQVGGVLERARQPAVDLAERQREVEHRGVVLDRERRGPDAVEREIAPGRVLEHEHVLEQRRVAERPLGLQCLHQLLEREVLMAVGAESDLAHPAQHVHERRARPDRSVRSTSVFAKKPMSASSSSRR